MNVRMYIPRVELREFIVSIMTIDAMLPDGMHEVVTPYPPAPHQSIIFYGDQRIAMRKEGHTNFDPQPGIVIIGPQYTRVNIKVSKQLKAVRVDFHPGGLFRLLGFAMNTLFDEGFDASDILGNEILRINEQIVNEPDVHRREQIVENYFLLKSKHLGTLLPFDRAVRELLRNDGNLTIEKVASHACLSLRQLERKFTERIGMNPKSFARIARFSKAYRLREAAPTLSWTDIAYRAGYFDQMHLIRDFKQFAGVTPGLLDNALSGTPFRMQAELIV